MFQSAMRAAVKQAAVWFLFGCGKCRSSVPARMEFAPCSKMQGSPDNNPPEMDSVSPFDQDQLLAEYADLRHRAAALDEQVPACLQRISDKLHRIGGETELADHYRSLLVGARSNALVSIENYHEVIPYLQAAESVIAQLAGQAGAPLDAPAAISGEAGGREALLVRLDDLIDAAVGMIQMAEQCFGDAKATDPDSVPPSILDDPLHPDL